MEPGKVWTPIGITRYNLAIEQNRFGWELVPQLPDARQAPDEVMPVAAVEDHARAYLVRLDAIGVELHLMQPTRRRRALPWRELGCRAG